MMNRIFMASARKRFAKPSNAKLGQPPRSTMDRARARRNALKTGLYAKTTLLPFEDAKAYAILRVSVFSEYGPQGAIEEGLVELTIADLWRLNRFVLIENAFLQQTKLALMPRPASPLPTDTLESVQRGYGGKIAVTEKSEDTANNALLESAHGNVVEIPNETRCGAVLLDAFVCRISQSPMEDVARQRRCTSRELLRNIAALEALQARRQAIYSTPFTRHCRDDIGGLWRKADIG